MPCYEEFEGEIFARLDTLILKTPGCLRLKPVAYQRL